MKERKRKVILAFAAILLLVAAWFLISHGGSRNAIDRYKAQLRAAGEKLTVDELLPPRVDPEKNGAELITQASPYLKFHGVIDTNRPPAKQMVGPGKAMIGWKWPGILSADRGRMVLNSWEDIEEDLKYRAPGVEILQKAVTYPELDFGLNDYDSSLGGLNYWVRMRPAARLLSAASSFQLHQGDTSSATTNLHASLALINDWKNEPVVVSQAVRLAMAFIACDEQWELLQATNLTDSELATLQRGWEEMEFVRPMEKTLKMARVLSVQTIQQFRSSNSPSMGLPPISSSSTSSSIIIKGIGNAGRHKTWDVLWRFSWSYEDELHDLQGYQVLIDTVREIETNGFFEAALSEKDRKLKALELTGTGTNWLRNSLNGDFWDVFGSTPEKLIDVMLTGEAARHLAVTAIALKRYQLRHGTWPVDLKALVPEFLSEVPKDPVDGKPLRYRQNADGTFLLYSIGSDGKDNGGDPTFTDSSYNWLHARDWVWPQPATTQEIERFYNNPPK